MFLQNVKSCPILEASISPCSTLAVLPFSFRVYWDRPTSVGYDTYFPSNAYGIDSYRVEVSADPSDFRTLAGKVTCVLGQVGSTCHFDRRVALVTGLTAGQVYYYRILATTIIGDGKNSTPLTSPIPFEYCNAGYYGNMGGTCAACAAGTYKNFSGYGSCGNCTAGRSGSVSCDTCNAGYYMNQGDTCVACAAGTYKNSSGSVSCAPCPAGTYTETTGSVSCAPCPAGTYKNSSGTESCTMCPVNTLSLNVGSVSVSDCVCALGYEWNESYTLRRLLQQDVTYDCLAEEVRLLLTDPVPHYVCIALRLLQEDVTYNCLAGEVRILLTDPVAHYVCRALPPPPPVEQCESSPVEQCESSPVEHVSPQNLSAPPITDAYVAYSHYVTVEAPPPRRLWTPPATDSYGSYNYHVTRRILEMEPTSMSAICVPCESRFYKDGVGNTRCHECPAGMFSQGGVNCTHTTNVTSTSTSTVGAATTTPVPVSVTTTPVPVSVTTTTVPVSVTTTPVPVSVTTPAPAPQPAGYVVKMAVSLPMTMQQFNNNEQLKFKQSVARTAGVSSADVSIDRIVDMNIGTAVLRRLLATGIRVDTSVKASDEIAASEISTSLTPDNLNSELVAAGLPAATILEAPTFASDRQATTAKVTVTPSPYPPESVSASALDLKLVVGVILGVSVSAVVILGVYLLWLKHST